LVRGSRSNKKGGRQIDKKAFEEAAEVVKASYGIKGY
jgi:phosphoribosyl-ATP pyrophosphohydrolase